MEVSWSGVVSLKEPPPPPHFFVVWVPQGTISTFKKMWYFPSYIFFIIYSAPLDLNSIVFEEFSQYIWSLFLII